MADKLPEGVAALRRVGKVRQNGPVLENCIAEKYKRQKILRGGDPEINSG